MPTVIKHKFSDVSGVEPKTSTLEQAELAVNTADANIFIRRDDGTILKTSIGSIQNGEYEAIASATGLVIDAFDAMLYRSAKYVIQCSYGTHFQTIEMLVMHDGTDVHITRYGLMFTHDELAEFTAEYDIVTNTIHILADVVNPSTAIKFTRTVVQA